MLFMEIIENKGKYVNYDILARQTINELSRIGVNYIYCLLFLKKQCTCIHVGCN